MDFVAELVLGWVDLQITEELGEAKEFKVLRYRDDYRIFANSDVHAEAILKVVSDKLRSVGMKLGVAKTVVSSNVVEGAIKPDKLAGIELQDLGTANANLAHRHNRPHSRLQDHESAGFDALEQRLERIWTCNRAKILGRSKREKPSSKRSTMPWKRLLLTMASYVCAS